MKHAFLAAALLVAASVAFADTTSVLLDLEKMRSMSAEEYAAAVRSAPDVNVRDKDERAYLHIAAERGTPDNIAALVSAGADVEARNKNGYTSLHYAALGGTPDNIANLLEAGASGSAKTENGKTAFDLAEYNDKVKGSAVYWELDAAQYK